MKFIIAQYKFIIAPYKARRACSSTLWGKNYRFIFCFNISHMLIWRFLTWISAFLVCHNTLASSVSCIVAVITLVASFTTFVTSKYYLFCAWLNNFDLRIFCLVKALTILRVLVPALLLVTTNWRIRTSARSSIIIVRNSTITFVSSTTHTKFGFRLQVFEEYIVPFKVLTQMDKVSFNLADSLVKENGTILITKTYCVETIEKSPTRYQIILNL